MNFTLLRLFSVRHPSFSLGLCALFLFCAHARAEFAQVELTDYFGKPFSISLVDQTRAEKLFQEMASQKHIPFGYPDDGCYARAHEMARLLDDRGVTSGKVFSVGSLHVRTKKGQDVYWGWHVAPILAVKERAGKWQLYVIDPSIFAKPVIVEAWKNSQLADPDAYVSALHYTKRFVYNYNWGNFIELDDYDPDDLTHTAETLRNYKKYDPDQFFLYVSDFKRAVELKDSVHGLRDAGDFYEVTFSYHAARYRLRKDAVNFAAVWTALDHSARSGESVALGLVPGTLELHLAK